MASCNPIAETDKFGSYEKYTSNTSMPGCTSPVHMGTVRFYGKNAQSNTPLFVAMDFEQYQIARVGMLIATSTAIIFGVIGIVMTIKQSKKRSFI